MAINTDHEKFMNELTVKTILTFGTRLIQPQSLQERIRYLIKQVTIMQELNKCLDSIEKSKKFSKSAEQSTDLRKKGNTLVQEGEIEESIMVYSVALSQAPPGSQEYILALVNRSVSLYLFKQYKKCVEDIDEVLDKETNPEKKVQLLKRKGKALQKLGHLEEAETVFEEARKALQNHSIKGHTKLTEEMEAALKSLHVSKETLTPQDGPHLPSVTFGLNKTFPYASAGVTLKSSAEKGRYVVANRFIRKGDTLFVEKPAAFALDVSCGKGRCGHCLVDLVASVPCLGCSAICFCSYACRQEALEEYHSLECGAGMDICYSLGVGFMAFRLGVMKIKKNPKYRSVEGLLAHMEHLDPLNLTQYCISALLLALYLKRVTKTEISLEQLSIELTKHLARMLCNANPVISLYEGCKKNVKNMYGIEQVEVALAIYQSVSMLNHSCDPNVMSSFSGAHIIVKATRDMKVGEEVLIAYIQPYQLHGYESRQKALLEKYNFICKCTACTSPDLKNYSLNFSSIVCSSCDGAMIQSPKGDYVCACSKKLSKKESTKLLEGFINVIDKSELLAETGPEGLRKALRIVLDALNRAKKILCKYHPVILRLTHAAAKLYTTMEKFEEAMNAMAGNLEATQARFGEESMEMVFECKKLLEVFSMAMFKGFMLSKKHTELAVERLDLAERVLTTFADTSSSLYEQFDSYKFCPLVRGKK